MNQPEKLYFSTAIIASAVIVILLHIYSAAYPSGLNWGMHHLGLFSAGVAGVFLLLMGILLYPPVQLLLLEYLEVVVDYVEKKKGMAKALLVLLIIGILIAIFWVGREQSLFLGDGHLVSRMLPLMAGPSTIAISNFNNEPLAALILYYTSQVFEQMGKTVSGPDIFHYVSIFFGILSIGMIWLLARLFTRNGVDRTLILLFLLAGGGSQLFFGYVEDYGPLYFGMLLYLYLSIRYLEGKTTLTIAGISYALLFLFHMGTLIFLPSLLLLIVHSLKHKRIFQVVQSVFFMLIITAVGLWMSGYSAKGFIDHFAIASNVSFAQQDPLQKTYGMFSFYHVLDVGNLLMLLSPFALFMLVLVGIFYFDRHAMSGNIPLFLVITGLGGLAFFGGINSLLGMSRDWDLFASYGIPICVAAVYAWNRFVPDLKIRRRLLVLMTAITLLHTVPWIMVNADDEKSFKRFDMLGDPHLWSMKSRANAYDEIGVWFRGHNDHAGALVYYKKYLELDSLNPRLIKNVGVGYGRTGDSLNKRLYFYKAIEHGNTDVDIFMELAGDEYRNNRLPEAYEVAKKGLAANPTSALLENEMGAVLFRLHSDYNEAFPHFVKSVELDPSMTDAAINAAQCCYFLNDTKRMNYYIDQVLKVSPNEGRALKLREMSQRGK